MLNLGLWQIKDNRPDRIVPSKVKLEQDLEDWIENDPNLLQEGLTIIGRQVHLKGGIADLLAVDTQGRWIVIEIKKGFVRRETIGQAIDYASCIEEMTTEELREIIIKYKRPSLDQKKLSDLDRIIKTVKKDELDISLIVVGTGHVPDLERMITYLSKKCNLSISVVSFEIFDLKDGLPLLIRELTDSDTTPIKEKSKKPVDIDAIFRLAEQNGVLEDFKRIHDVAIEMKLYPRPYKYSIMYTHPNNRNRVLFTLWANHEPKKLIMYNSVQGFAEFFPYTEEQILDKLGPSQWRTMEGSSIDDFIRGLKELLADQIQE